MTVSRSRHAPAGVPGRVARHWPQMLTILAVFLLLLVVASGRVELSFSLDSGRSNFGVVSRTPEFAVLLGCGLAMSLLLPLLSPINGALLTLICMAPVYWNGIEQTYRPLIPLEFSLLALLVVYVLHVLLSYFREIRQKQKVIGLFSQYVPPQLALQLSRDPDAWDLQGESREITVMFCDARDFTRICETLEPRQIVSFLNAMFTPLTEIVHRHQGTIDKYMGDALMAFWGAPLPDPHHAARAVTAAFEMHEALAARRDAFARDGLPEPRIGIGINTGVASVGNMGSSYRIAYTAVGDAVNLASRLQALTRVYDTRIIVGETTRKAFPAAVYRELGLAEVKGKQHLERIYEPCNPSLDPHSTAVASMRRHNDALEHYYRREWDGAEHGFAYLQRSNPDDPLYGYYLQRIREFRRTPPPAGWRGEIRDRI